MTITASGTAPDIGALERPQSAAPIAVLVQTPLGAVVGGTLQGDVLILSAQALALLRARAFVRALVLVGLESMRRLVALANGRRLILEYGIYRLR